MQAIELYIEGQRVDMFKDESVSITQSIKNVKDISKVFTDFTRTFSIPASKINNKIFKHYYNLDIEGGFDARTKKDANIELNSLPFRDGKIKLEDVNLKDNKAHTYRITFFGKTVELKDLLGEDKLNLLDYLEQYDHRQQHQFDGFKTGIGVNGAISATEREVTYPFISTNEDISTMI